MGGVSSERGSWAGGVLLGDTYLLGRPINRGGMGEVFEATHARLPGRYAVKILLPELTGHREAFARFCREAEVMSELRHPNVVQIFDFNTTPDGRPYFVMELLEGRDLETRLNEGGPLPLPFAVRIVDSVASALAAAHAHGIVHRDLKPGNIFLVTVDGQPDELVKVLDFGISKVRAAGTLLSTPTDMLGTPPYMSPEQARGDTELIDGRTDQFALGAIAYRMLTGRDPFTGGDIASLLYQVVHQNPPPLATYVPPSWDTRALQSVLDKAMAKDPGQRWPGMVEMARAFEAASEQTLSRMPSDAGVDLASTLISAPPPPPTAGTTEAPLTPTPVVRARMATPVVRPLTPSHVVRPDAVAIEPTLPAVVTDEPPPVRTPAPDPVPSVSAFAAPPRPEHRSPPAVVLPSRYDWEPTGTIDDVPVEHHRLALFGVLVGIAAVFLAVTGTYRKVPGLVAGVIAGVRGHSARVLAPAVPAPAAPARASPETARAPAPAPSSAQTAASAPPAPASPAPQPAERSAGERPRHEHRHRAAATGPRYIDHPGSINLSAGAADPAAASEPPGAPGVTAAPAPEPAPSSGFGIAPPAPTTDTPAHDIAPPAPADSDQPMAPSVR